MRQAFHTRRLNMLLTEKQGQVLDQLCETIGCTQSEVFRKALALLTVVHDENKAGNRIAVVGLTGNKIKEFITLL
jgi:hypothetical protein